METKQRYLDNKKRGFTHPALVGVIGLDVLLVPLGQLLNGGLDGPHAPRDPHVRGGEVGVSSGTIPVPNLDK